MKRLASKKYGRKAALFSRRDYQAIPRIEGDLKLVNSQNILPVLTSIIKNAKSRIYIAVYQAVYLQGKPKSLVNKIWNNIRERQAEGVEVKVLINQNFQGRTAKEINIAVAQRLRRKNIPARWHAKHTRGHAKFYVVDGIYSVVGSHNMSERAVRENYEMSVYIKNALIAKQLEESFLDCWNKGVEIN